eukprot:305659-Prorocentrum_minimum.AAC.1
MIRRCGDRFAGASVGRVRPQESDSDADDEDDGGPSDEGSDEEDDDDDDANDDILSLPDSRTSSEILRTVRQPTHEQKNE